MKALLAYFVCRVSSFLLKLIKRGGSLPGELALKIDKDILKKIKYPKQVILVSATNGKTSTTNLIANILQNTNQRVIHNHKGDNLAFGISALLLTNANFKLEVNADIAVIEIDELTLSRYGNDIKATHILINNFFRDQLDRSGEMENVVSRIEEGLKEYSGILILNHDDPSVLRIKNQLTNAKVLTYHLNENSLSKKTSKEASEGKFCPVCHSRIGYDYYQYSHIGKYVCHTCGFGSETPNYSANIINIDTGEFEFNQVHYIPSNPNLYHIYNCLAALTLCENLNVDIDSIKKVIAEFEMTLGRNEVIQINDKPCLLNLVKNPTGCNEIVKMINKDKETKSILFALNDNVQDSTDVSWIWDVDFEQFENLDKIICTGKRAYEIALRFKYGELDLEIVVEENITSAIQLLSECNTHIYAVATYTALPIVRKEMLAWK